MKGKKCFGLLFLLAIIFGLSLNASSNVFAERFYYTSLFIPGRQTVNFNDVLLGTSPPYLTSYPSSNPLSHQNIKEVRPFNYSEYDSSTSSCRSISGYSSIVTASGLSASRFYYTDELVPIAERCTPLDGSWYGWDSLYLSSLDYDGSRHYAKLSDYFNDTSSYWYSFTLPLTIGSNPGLFDSGDTYEWVLSFKSSTPFRSSDLVGNLSPDLSHLHINFSLQTLWSSSTRVETLSATDTSPHSSSEASISCTKSLRSSSRITFRCRLSDIPAQIYKPTIGFSLFDDRGSNYPIFYNSSDIYFDDFYVITNDDDTPSSYSASVGMSGTNRSDAPGYSSVIAAPADEDWLHRLTNLFSFNFFNPFAPIFTMFTDNSECASIPIIAGMLHSNVSSYCPWFSSSTRNILTPVIGLSSLMLIFGFLVRWLSSSSGNMFEDQTVHKWGNTQFKQKGGK